MFIKNCIKTNKRTGKIYTYHYVMASCRVDGKSVSRMVLPLWRGFDAPREQWPIIMGRVEALLAGRPEASPPRSGELDELCGRIVDAILERRAKLAGASPEAPGAAPEASPGAPGADPAAGGSAPPPLPGPRRRGRPADPDGIAQAALLALETIGLKDALLELGFPPDKAKAAMCLVAARMEGPDGEFAVRRRLADPSCPLGPLVGLDFGARSQTELYRIPEKLYEMKDAIEKRLIPTKISLFSSKKLFFHYDLTNTLLEQHRVHEDGYYNDFLVTLCAIIDDNNCIHQSFFFPGKVGEIASLPEVIKKIGLSEDHVVVMDESAATDETVRRLAEDGYKYVAVRRLAGGPPDLQPGPPPEPEPPPPEAAFDPSGAVAVFKSPAGDAVRLHLAPARAEGAASGPAGESTFLCLSEPQAPGSSVGAFRTNAPDQKPRDLWEACHRHVVVGSVFRDMERGGPVRRPGRAPSRAEKRVFGRRFVAVLACRAILWLMGRIGARGVRRGWDGVAARLSVVDCATALDAESDAAESLGRLPSAIVEARAYLRSIGLDPPAKPVAGRR